MRSQILFTCGAAYFETLCVAFHKHLNHGLRTPGEEITFPAQPKIKSQSQTFRYGRSIFCLPLRPKFSDFFDLCLHWVSVVCGYIQSIFLVFFLYSTIIFWFQLILLDSKVGNNKSSMFKIDFGSQVYDQKIFRILLTFIIFFTL